MTVVLNSHLTQKELSLRLQVDPLRRDTIPLEYRTSWLVPYRHEGRTVYAGFFYPSNAAPGGPRQVGRPRWWFLLDPTDGSVLRLVDCFDEDFAAGLTGANPLGAAQPPPAGSVDELLSLNDQLRAAGDAVFRLAGEPAASLTPSQVAEVRRYRRLRDLLTEGPLQPFYAALSPWFEAWLAEVTA